jgi:hypothetical protein
MIKVPYPHNSDWSTRTVLVKEICVYLHDTVCRVDAACLNGDQSTTFHGTKLDGKDRKWRLSRMSDAIVIEVTPKDHESFLALKYGAQ